MKKKFARQLAALGCIIVLTASLSACGSSSSTNTSTATTTETSVADNAASSDSAPTEQETAKELNADITFWSSNTETSNYGQVIAEAATAFMDLHPSVKIEISFQGTDIQSTLGPAMDAGTKVTMFEANTDASVNLWKDKMLDLSGYYSQVFPQTNNKIYEESILPAYAELAKNQGDGTYLYFPYLPQFVSVWYNKDIFDACNISETPKSWEELMTICDTLVENEYTPFISDQNHIHYAIGYYVERLLGDDAARALVFDETGEKWDNPAILEMAQMFEDMAAKGYYADDIMTVVPPEAQQEFVIDQKVAMYIGGSWMPNNLRESAGEDFRWGNFAYPTVPNGVDDQTALGYGCYGISINKEATAEEADAAAAFAVFLTQGEFGQKLVDTCNAIPVTNDGAAWPPMIADAQPIFDGVTIRYASHTAFALNNDLLPTVKSAFTKLIGGAIDANGFIEEIKAYY